MTREEAPAPLVPRDPAAIVHAHTHLPHRRSGRIVFARPDHLGPPVLKTMIAFMAAGRHQRVIAHRAARLLRIIRIESRD